MKIVLISPQLMNFNFSQPMKRPCLSFLILQWKKKKTSFGTVDPQDVVAALGKARSGEATYSDSSSSPFLLTLDYQSKDADGKVLLEKTGAFYRISLLKFETLKK